MGESKALQRGFSIAAIILIAVSTFAFVFFDARGILEGDSATFAGMPLMAIISVLLLGVLIFLVIRLKNTDTVENMIASVAVRYAFFGWFYVFLIKFADMLIREYVNDYTFFQKYYSSVYLLMNSFNVCVVGTLVIGLTMRQLPTYRIAQRKLRVGQLLLLIMMMYGLTLVGTVMGLPIHSFLSSFTVDNSQSEAVDLSGLLLGSGIYFRIICVGILPAIFEELLFRKFLIDRTIRHGEFISCVMSGLMFGMWHGNFQQFFFATFIGILFAFVYIRTGKIIYTMIMHASMNLVTTVITMSLLSEMIKKMGVGTGINGMNEDELMSSIMPLLLLLLLWLVILVSFMITGLVMVIKKRKNFKLFLMVGELKRKEILHNLTHSPAMWIFLSFVILLFFHYYLTDIFAYIFQ